MNDDVADIRLTSEITVRPIQQVGGDHMVVAAARVSTSGEGALKFAEPGRAEESAGLIKYLVKMRHGSAIEHSSLTFFVHAPIFVFREWFRHRIGWSFNETSGRYAQLDPVFWVPDRERKLVPAPGFKSARPTFVRLDDDEKYDEILADMAGAYRVAYQSYLTLLKQGVGREVARSVLPVGIYSSAWVTCNPRSLMHFLSLRTHDPTATYVSYPQAEIEEAARACEKVFESGWPLTYKAWVECGRVAP